MAFFKKYSSLFKALSLTSGTTFVLSLFVPILLIWSKNTHMYLPSDMILTLFILFIPALMLFLLGFGIDKLRLTCFNQNTKISIFLTLVTCTIIGSILYFFLSFTLSKLISSSTNRILLIGSFILSLTFFISFTKSSFKFLNTFLSILLIFSATNITLNILSEESPKASSIAFPDLTAKKNIYLVILESFHDLDTMSSVYHIDTTRFKNFLTEKKFTLYPDTYSNGYSTLSSIYSTYSMSFSKKPLERGLLDANRKARFLIGGESNNTLFSYLKKQGYTIDSYYPSPNYYMFRKGANLDYCNLIDRQDDFTLNTLVALNNTLSQSNHYIKEIIKNCFYRSSKIRKKNLYTLSEYTENTLNRIISNNTPSFYILKAGAQHSPVRGHSWRDRAQWISSNFYQNEVERSFDRDFSLVQKIIEKDKDAVVILMGDHGAWGLRNIWAEVQFGNIHNLKEVLSTQGYTPKDLAKDIFGIFLAIRMPEGYPLDISKGDPITPVNLFRYIFAALDDNPDFIKNRAENISKIHGITLVKNGIILPENQ